MDVGDPKSFKLALGPPPRYISPEELRSVPLSVVEPAAVAPFWVGLADAEPFAAEFAVVGLCWVDTLLAKLSQDVPPLGAWLVWARAMLMQNATIRKLIAIRPILPLL